MIRAVIVVVDDMFFVSKIRATAKALGMVVGFPRGLEAFRAAVGEDLPHLIIVDLHHGKLNPMELAAELKANERLSAVTLLGFFSHVETDLQRRAAQAGYDEVLPRSVFFRELANILAGNRKSKEPGE